MTDQFNQLSRTESNRLYEIHMHQNSVKHLYATKENISTSFSFLNLHHIIIDMHTLINANVNINIYININQHEHKHKHQYKFEHKLKQYFIFTFTFTSIFRRKHQQQHQQQQEQVGGAGEAREEQGQWMWYPQSDRKWHATWVKEKQNAKLLSTR